MEKLYQNYKHGRGFDLLGLGSVGIGNIRTDASLGLATRWATNREFFYVTFSLQADRQVNSLTLSPQNDFFVYLGMQGSAAANDLLVDGNTFEDNHSLPLKHFQGQVSGGIVLKYGPLAYVLQLTSKSSTSTIKTIKESFESFSVTFNFR